MIPKLSYRRTGMETLRPAKKTKINYECLKDYNFVKRNSWRLDFIPAYKKLEQAPKFKETKNAIFYMANSNAYTNDDNPNKDYNNGINYLVLDRLLKASNLNIGKQKNIQNFNRLSESLRNLSEVDENDIRNLTVKQHYTSKNLASDVYNTIKYLSDAEQDEMLNSFNMYLIDDGTGQGCVDDKINESHLSIFGYPKNHSSIDIPISSPLINNIFAIEQFNQRFNSINNLEIGTENENLNGCIRIIIETYPELITMFDTSLKKQNGLITLKNILVSIKDLYSDNLFANLDIDKKNVLISAIILNNISQINEEDEHDRIIQNAHDAFSITNKYCNLENRKLVANLILVNDEKDMIDYACGLEHSFDECNKNVDLMEDKIDDSIAAIFKGEQIILYYLFQKYGRNNEISPEKFHKLKNFAAIANNIDLIIRAALDITILPNNADLLYFNCKNKNASCIRDEILTKDKNGFIIIDIAKMQNKKIPEEKQEKYFKEMGINCKTVEDFKLLIHSCGDLESHLSAVRYKLEYLKCDPNRAITDMMSMESNQIGYQRLCTSFISNNNNNLFCSARIAFIVNPDNTIFLDAYNDDLGIASKDAYSVHQFNEIFGDDLVSEEQDKIEIKLMNMEEIKQKYNKDIETLRNNMLITSSYYTEVSISNIDVAGIVVDGKQETNYADIYDILKEPPIENYIKMKNIPIIRINLNGGNNTKNRD
ncbi:MAG: hypothetical protein BHW64_02490 [Candidatus Melainabacteria bacterium LEY3_CP_29_8]|nr:MAG: hypothetical protein BHW64_02490 [Candidatus Melainabacteria bacterium LEY3_CP_29_8]